MNSTAVRPEEPLPPIDHAFYGSWSGHGIFEILACSKGITKDDKDVILQYSNLGGTVQTAASPSPIYCFYELDRTRLRWAFSRTVFLGAGGRGNDYLAHVLLLGPEVVAALRGDVFLLEGLFASDKPYPPTAAFLPQLELDPTLKAAARARCGSAREAGFPTDRLASILGVLARQPLALPAEDGRRGTALCRSVLSVLPPDDRARLSFCSTFAVPRGVSFRLVAYNEGDIALVSRYLARFDPQAAVHAAASTGRTPFHRWMELVERGIDPLQGISLLERPDECTGLAACLLDWLAWSGAESGPSPRERARRQGWPLLEVVNDSRNRDLEQVGLVRIDALLESIEEQVRAALAGRSITLSDICHAARERDPDSTVADPLLAAAALHAHRGDRAALTTAVTVALLVPAEPRLDRIYRPEGGGILNGPEHAARWIAELHESNPAVCRELLTAWFSHWRWKEAPDCLREAGRILSCLRSQNPSRGVRGAAGLVLA
ncbi:MAG: hypothetical protein M3O15_10565, partial [Acidobacteriota bacterium]|nr:hypothetical protein [Acidobacteriota bacterium]